MPRHKPVLLKETLQLLGLREGEVVMDATLGSAGHAQCMAEAVGAGGRLIGLDQDPASIARCSEILGSYPQVTLRHSNFADADIVLKELNIERLDAVLIDTGFSSDQLEDPSRGISFERDGPLDMRLNPFGDLQARDVVNQWPQSALEKIFWEWGEERWSRKFARVICEERQERDIETTFELVSVLAKALPKAMTAEKGRRPAAFRRHFATKVFQALRICVNDELKILEKALKIFWNHLNYAGRIVVIDFHSLEDRIVKNYFRELKQSGQGELLVKKPVEASDEERSENPRSRSAKLRGIRKII